MINHSTPALSTTSLSMTAISMPILPAALQPSNNGLETPANADTSHKNNHSLSEYHYQRLKERMSYVSKHGSEILRDINHIRSSPNDQSLPEDHRQHLKEKSSQVIRQALDILKDIHHTRSSLNHRRRRHGAIFETEETEETEEAQETEESENGEPASFFFFLSSYLALLVVSPDDGNGVAEITATVGDMQFPDVAGGLDAETLKDTFASLKELAEASGGGLSDAWDTFKGIAEALFTVGSFLAEL
ncbi:hypothetical protein GGR51DRAFT_563978 [Nemania sp. FL0031]|nr:hypothetical protein GGR51DRAFT_563978 [Nemania sp. FL0031]